MKIRIVWYGHNDQTFEFDSDDIGFGWSQSVQGWDEKHFTDMDSTHNMSFYKVSDEEDKRIAKINKLRKIHGWRPLL